MIGALIIGALITGVPQTGAGIAQQVAGAQVGTGAGQQVGAGAGQQVRGAGAGQQTRGVRQGRGAQVRGGGQGRGHGRAQGVGGHAGRQGETLGLQHLLKMQPSVISGITKKQTKTNGKIKRCIKNLQGLCLVT